MQRANFTRSACSSNCVPNARTSGGRRQRPISASMNCYANCATPICEIFPVSAFQVELWEPKLPLIAGGKSFGGRMTSQT
jgi:predicted alpha/beta-hydrolase family hydrolase